MITTTSPAPLRFVVHHIHPTSARLRFLTSVDFHVVFPTKLPSLSELLDNHESQNYLSVHPSQYLQRLCETLQIPPQLISIVNEFRCWVDTPKQTLPIYLVKVLTEQPFDAPEGCRWIELPDCFALLEIERQIMHRVYDSLLGHD